MNNRYNSLFQFLFSFFDLLSLNIVFVVTLFNFPDTTLTFPYLILFISWNASWLLASAISSLYINVNYFKYEIFIRRSVETIIFFGVLILLFRYIYNYEFAPYFITIISCIYIGGLALSRFSFILGSKFFNLQAKLVRRIVIIGYNDVAKQLAHHHLSYSKNIEVEGFFEDYKNIKELSTYPILGNIDEVLDYSKKHNISEIYSTLNGKDHPYLYDVAEEAENNFIRFKFVPDFHVFANREVHIEYLEDTPILSLRHEPLEDIGNRIKKRIFDILFSLMVIILLLSWLIPILAILIKLDSKGPVFYNQNRLGRDLKKIRVFKFRTMKSTDSDTQFKQATKNDPRVTKIGRILRKTSLDEIPQFFNVLLGNMSVVGPRPHPLKMNDDYKSIINKYMIRHFLKPGITGWAQINGYRGETKDLKDIKGRIEHDIRYMEKWNFWLDLRIIFLTAYNIIKGEKNAY
ncbi:undecaprenyl-phosphate glucose phosphotransferase [soil metagenome]